jgi:hypothetical protein
MFTTLRQKLHVLSHLFAFEEQNPQFEHYYADLLEHSDGWAGPRADEAIHDYEAMLHRQLAA